MDDFSSELILNHTLLAVLEHFRLAKVDYAKNVTRYTEIQRETVLSCIHELEEHGLLEKYTNTSIKRTAAKLKKSAEVHKHHTYFQITRNGVITLNDIQPRTYLEFLAPDCLSRLASKKARQSGDDRCRKMINMGLLSRNLELTELGKMVLMETRK